MIVIPGTRFVFMDVDDTLIMWSGPSLEDSCAVEITCPASMVMNGDGVLEPSGSWTQRVTPHRYHIEQLKLHKSRGHTVVVWSAGGWDWAKAAVLALKLQDYVDVVMSKPSWAYDDKKPEEYMPASYYVKQE